MADNNSLVFYQQWAVAWLQMDKYSTNPWCVDSKNLDIFSDTQSVKAMAWTDKEVITNDWVDIDPRERFYLASDGRVWDSQEEVWYTHAKFDTYANNINYDDWQWYNKAQFWTPKKLMVAYSWDDWMTISVVTDRLVYNIYHYEILLNGRLSSSQNCKNDWNTSASYRVAITSTSAWHWCVSPEETVQFAVVRYKIEFSWDTFNNVSTSVYSNWIKWNNTIHDFDITKSNYWEWEHLINEDIWTVEAWGKIEWETYLDNFFNEASWIQAIESWFRIDFSWTSTDAFYYVYFYMKESWRYLYPKDRNILEIEDEVYLEWLDSTQYEQLYYDPLESKDWNTYYDLITWNILDFPDWYNIVAFARAFDYQYIFVNKGDMWIVYYATDENLSAWERWFRFPWMQFVNAIMIWQYVYVIAEERGIRWLYVYYNWDMKKLVWADMRYTEWLNLIDWKEKYNFNWIMVNWRNNVVCATKDSVFMRWRNKLWNNVWTFILNTEWEIVDIKTDRGYLDVYFTIWQTKYRKVFQDDVNLRRYEPEFEVIYPIQIDSHMLEKEPLKLAVSYDIPNSSTSMDVYLSVNDYHFWSFLTDWTVEPEVWDKFKVSWLSWDYWLIFVEKNWNWLTFTLDGNIPYQSANTKNLVSEDTLTTIAYTDFNHFKKIWTISKTSPQEKIGKHTLLNISNGNDLPIVRKAQVKIVWKTDNHVSPLLYDVMFLSNKYDK